MPQGVVTLSEKVAKMYHDNPQMTLSEIAVACGVKQAVGQEGWDAVEFVKQAVGWRVKI